MNKRILLFFVMILIPIFLTGCATIPKESVSLSEQLSGMIIDAKSSHVNMINLYFDEKVEKIREFALGEYKTAYISNLADIKKEKGESLSIDSYDKAMTRIVKKMEEWTQEVERIRRRTLNETDKHYYLMTQTNESITGLLRSSINIEEARQKITDKLGIDVKKIVDFDKLDTEVQGIIDQMKKAKSKYEKVKEDIEGGE